MAKIAQKKVEMSFYQYLYLNHTVVPNMLLRHYQDIGLNHQECIFLLSVIGAFPKGKTYVTYNDIKSFWHSEDMDLQTQLLDFVKRSYLTKSMDTAIEDGYNLDGLYDKLFELWVFLQACPKPNPLSEEKQAQGFALNEQKMQNDHFKDQVRQIYALFEGELARPLSPTEIEKVNKWLIDDGWSGEMIKEAVKRAVFHGTCNLVYIDKVLWTWQKAGIASLEQLNAEDSQESKTAKRTPKKSNKKAPEVSIIENNTNYNDIYKF